MEFRNKDNRNCCNVLCSVVQLCKVTCEQFSHLTVCLGFVFLVCFSDLAFCMFFLYQPIYLS